MDIHGFEKVTAALPDGEHVSWSVGIGDIVDVFADGKDVKYITAQLAKGTTPAGVLNQLAGNKLLDGTGEHPLTGPQLKVIGGLSSSTTITFEDTQSPGADDLVLASGLGY